MIIGVTKHDQIRIQHISYKSIEKTLPHLILSNNLCSYTIRALMYLSVTELDVFLTIGLPR
jgi:hypothetical protein